MVKLHQLVLQFAIADLYLHQQDYSSALSLKRLIELSLFQFSLWSFRGGLLSSTCFTVRNGVMTPVTLTCFRANPGVLQQTFVRALRSSIAATFLSWQPNSRRQQQQQHNKVRVQTKTAAPLQHILFLCLLDSTRGWTQTLQPRRCCLDPPQKQPANKSFYE